MNISPNSPATDEIVTGMMTGNAVPQGWESVPGKYINAVDFEEDSWQDWLSRCAMQVVATIVPGGSKKENGDYYKFDMTPNFELSKSLKERGMCQYNVTIRLPQLPDMKAKKTHYTFHFWADPTTDHPQEEGTVCTFLTFLWKLKLEGKYIPSSPEECEQIRKMAEEWRTQHANTHG
jgi:hypothetical protein